MKNTLVIAKLLTVAGALGLSASVALADSISPTSFSATLGVGESVTINKTVTVNAGTPTSSKVDVFFLADTTGSMGSTIAAVKASATSIMTTASGLGDVAFGVGEYKDAYDSFSYQLNANITSTIATAQAGINLWAASGGGDTPEAVLHALTMTANTTAWRTGSKRLAVIFGDAPGHEPDVVGAETRASTIAALNARGVSVLAVDVGNLNGSGQFTNGSGTGIVQNVAGSSYQAGINSATIVAAINAAIINSFATYSVVGLDLSDAPAGVTVTSSPSWVGAYDRSITRNFGFTVTFTAAAAGTYDFPIYGTVDGGRVATETDHIEATVPDGGATVLMLGVALAGLGLARRRKE